MRRPLFVALLLLLLFARRADAHQASIVYSEIAASGHTVEITFQIADADVGAALGDERTRPSQAAVLAHADAISRYLAARVTVDNAGYPCAPAPRGVAIRPKSDGFFAAATLDYTCKRTAFDVTIHYALFFDLDALHQGFARIRLPGQAVREHVFRTDARELRLEQPVTLLDNVRDYLVLGIAHIFTGYDHLAFLFGLLAVAGFATLSGGLKYVLGIVTAFTVAHSITLIASGLDLIRLPPSIVEPAIALSIAYVAVENLLVEHPKHRWLLTFCFGLVHGFGFASVLREIGLPSRGLVLSLFSFNVGVELGQLAVVALVAPVLYLLYRARWSIGDRLLLPALMVTALLLLGRFGLPLGSLVAVVVGAPLALLIAVPRVGYDRAVRIGGSLVLLALSSLWFCERVLGASWLRGWLG
ncbi:MAG TPA: HupE/UreJ family protein [Polyangia bacterium]